MGSRSFIVLEGANRSRKQLPFLRPENESINMLSLLGKLFGQDLTKISLPVILSEPLSSLQKACESTNVQEHMMQTAAKTPDSMHRLGLCFGHFLSQLHMGKERTKKPFNPMLGETYELVTPDFRFISEQVSHHPPVSAFF